MFDHIAVRTPEFERLKYFYMIAMRPLGIRVAAEYPGGVGFCRAGRSMLWLGHSEHATSSVDVAFHASSRAQVDEFYRVAIEAGAAANGIPGTPGYHQGHYSAFVTDPDGNNILAVFHETPAPAPDAGVGIGPEWNR